MSQQQKMCSMSIDLRECDIKHLLEFMVPHRNLTSLVTAPSPQACHMHMWRYVKNDERH
jgi:hypothetical protein